jgi:hypothetical protein
VGADGLEPPTFRMVLAFGYSRGRCLAHPLKGGRLSVWVDENYRVTFTFENGHAYEVDYEDYH